MIYKTGERISEKESIEMAYKLAEILAENEDVIIDMKNTQYVVPSGIRVLLSYLKQFRAKGYDFSVVNVNHPLLKEIFTTVGLNDILLTSDKYFNDNKRGRIN